MYIYGVYFFLNLFNFTKYSQNISTITNILLIISVICYGYKYLIYSLFTPNFIFKTFLYKILFYISNINYNILILYIY